MRFIEILLYGVKATDLGIVALPVLTIFTEALPAVIRAVRIRSGYEPAHRTAAACGILVRCLAEGACYWRP